MKLVKEVKECTVEFADNGFIVRANGRDNEGDWTDMVKICQTMEDVVDLMKKLSAMSGD